MKNAVCLVSLMWAVAYPAAGLDVKLSVQESAGVARTDEPVSGGVPLPLGLVRDLAEVSLTGPDGKNVPAQMSAINRWASDGSVMWLLVQSTATVPANGEVFFNLRAGKPPAATTPASVVDGNDSVEVNTGSLKFRVSKKSFRLIDEAWYDSNADGRFDPGEQVIGGDTRAGSVLTAKNGEVYASGSLPPREVVVEEKGPQRITILARGLHGPEQGTGYLPYCYGYAVRIRAYAGRPYLRISYTITDDSLPAIGSPELNDSSIGIPLLLAGNITAAAGGRERVSGPLADGAEVAVTSRPVQTDEKKRSVNVTVSGLGSESSLEGPAGWAAVMGDKWGASLSVRYLRENFPCALKVRRAGKTTWLELKPWPAEVDEVRYLDVCSHKTWEMQLSFEPGNSILEKAPALFLAQNNYLRFWPPVEWTAATRAWSDFGGLAILDDASRKLLARESDFTTTGWRLFGSAPEMQSGSASAPGGGYEPLISDVVFYNGYMQTGQRRLFDQVERTSWFWRDRRLIHREDDVSLARWEGSGTYTQYAHKGFKDFTAVQPADYMKKFTGPWNYGGHWGPMDTQHFSVDEVVNYFYMTGDRQCLTAMAKYAEQAAYLARTCIKDVKEKGSSRAHGWTMRALVAVYEATGEKRWLDLLKDTSQAICQGQDKAVGTVSPHTEQQTPFMNAVVGMALGRYYRHHPEEEIRDAILGVADWMHYDMAKPGGGFSYHWTVDDPGGKSVSGNRCMSTMAWAYLATGQPRYLEAADLHAGGKLTPWYINGFGQEYVTIKTGARGDAAAPSAVNTLAAVPLGGGKVTLTWTAPGDDADKGRAAEYQVKYAGKEIKDHADWRTASDTEISFWAAVNCKGEPVPSAAGSAERFVVEGLAPGTYWFALKSYDEQPNQSDLSNVVKVNVN